jgi:hypothetical protein
LMRNPKSTSGKTEFRALVLAGLICILDGLLIIFLGTGQWVAIGGEIGLLVIFVFTLIRYLRARPPSR